ncbi:hypothetical protein [Leptospira bandrabouensis]|uniref:hypothetical protein n=1 Tax=Leptospira bandrabouensis TaxID=2484903 RepID=UPI001EE8D403|nr:hypothetical protein [Leptospira bandrabouensis]MCG6146601.1 hypothetical protein [Leptospira bandrabouensis]MCG6161933.1 hypothetical protein [Leptospira bandrabouensis]MCG6166182.1 hypothetical protein [Leptospira bandrabouensis]
MKFYVIILLLIGNSIYSQTLFETQSKIRIEKQFSIYTGQNSVSYYYSMQFLGASYAFDSKNEIGVNLIFSKYSSNDKKSILPSQSYLFVFNEKFSFEQNSLKVFYNYFIFNSPFFFNATIGSLPEVSQTYSAIILPIFSNNNSELNINVTRKATAYFSPGLGMKLILDNGIFFSVFGGPMFIYENQIKSNSYSYLTSNSDYQNISSTFIFNYLIESKKKDLFGFSKRNSEAYIDFSAGISF